jgi:hypothetical protein
MLRSKLDQISMVLVLGVLLPACDDQLTQPAISSDPSFTILDGARAGNPQFFFLPPMVPAPSYSGTFDASQSPVVHSASCPATPVVPPSRASAAAL